MGVATTGPPPDGGWYEIRLHGCLDRRWSEWFDGLTIATGADGSTILRGAVVDQAALHGLLQRLRDLGIPLMSLSRLGPEPAPQPTPDDPQHEETGDKP